MAVTLSFCEFKEKSNIKNVIIAFIRKENNFSIFIYCLEKDIDFEEKRIIEIVSQTWTFFRFGEWRAKLGIAQRKENYIKQKKLFFKLYFWFLETDIDSFFFQGIKINYNFL